LNIQDWNFLFAAYFSLLPKNVQQIIFGGTWCTLAAKNRQKQGNVRTQHLIECWLADRQERAFEIQHGGLIESRAILW
jgi:hypothetical protein